LQWLHIAPVGTRYSPNYLTFEREVYGTSVDILYGGPDETNALMIDYDFVAQTHSRMIASYAEVIERRSNGVPSGTINGRPITTAR